MTDKSDIPPDDWQLLIEAPLLVTVAMFAAGQHGPISMMKESAASARLLTQTADRGGLVAQIAPESHSKEARHDASHRKAASMAEAIDGAVADLAPAVAVIDRLPETEAAQVKTWLLDIAKAVAEASKGVSATEAETIDKVAAALGIPST